MGWAGALEAPSHGRFGMVPFVYVRVELMAARRAMRRPKQPREGRPCCFRRVRAAISACAPMGRQACKHMGKTVQVLGRRRRRRRYYQLWVLLYMGDGGQCRKRDDET